MGKTRSIAIRLLGSATLWILLPLVISGVVISHYLQEPILETLDTQISNDLTRLVEFTRFDQEGELATYEKYFKGSKFMQVDSGWYWSIYERKGKRELGRSNSMVNFQIPYDRVPPPGKPTVLTGIGAEKSDLKVIVKMVRDQQSKRTYKFLVGANPKFVIDAVEKVDNRLFWSFAITALALFIGLLLQVRFGLSPLKKLGKMLNDVREGKTQKLVGPFPREISALTQELNDLLKEFDTVLNRSRTEVGNLAHALKTPISVIGNENRQPTENREKIIQAEIEKIDRHIGTYLAKENVSNTRTLSNELTSILPVMRSLATAVEKQYFEKNIKIYVKGPDKLFFKGLENDLIEMLGNLLENAGKWTQTSIWLSGEPVPGSETPRPMLRLIIDDDGPGIPETLRDNAFARGKRLDESTPGTGIGLHQVRTCSALYTGDITLEDSPKGGLRAVLTLPSH